MEKIKLDINKYKKKNTKLCKTAWQQYAKDTCHDFGVIHPYDKIVFKYAKSNLVFLKAQVTNLKEQATYKKQDTKTYGPLLTYKLNEHKKKSAKQKPTLPLCTSCQKPIKKKQQWSAMSWTEKGKIETTYRHTTCHNI